MNATDSIQNIEITTEALVAVVDTELNVGASSEAAAEEAADQDTCKNGVCAVLWKPNKVAA
jgi:hypothetical protein